MEKTCEGQRFAGTRGLCVFLSQTGGFVNWVCRNLFAGILSYHCQALPDHLVTAPIICLACVKRFLPACVMLGNFLEELWDYIADFGSFSFPILKSWLIFFSSSLTASWNALFYIFIGQLITTAFFTFFWWPVYVVVSFY